MKLMSVLAAGFITLMSAGQPRMMISSQSSDGMSVDSQRALVNQYCAGCHNDKS